MNILYQYNDKYAPYAGVSMTSILENNKEVPEITFWILGEGLSDDNIARTKQMAEHYSDSTHTRKVTFVDSTDMIEEMKSLNMPTYRGSYAANIRLFVSRFIPEEIDRLLYLDADTVIEGDLTQLFNTDLKGHSLGMIYDSLGENHKSDLGITDSEGYYNSGVILFDLKSWRSNHYTMKIVDHVKNVRAQYPSPDQDLINVVCKGDIFTFDARYNYQPFHKAYSNRSYYRYYGKTLYYTPDEITEAGKNVVIYHCFRFVGEFPWHKGSVHPFNDEFDKYLRISEWSDYEKKPSSNSTSAIIRIEKVVYRILPKFIFIRIFHIAHGLFYRNANAQSENNKISTNM